jgi:glycosyltransferase involved in cell wall biosynthesis
VRIFIFLPQLPYPPHSGGRIVTAPLVRGLCQRHEVHLFALTHGLEGEIEAEKQLRKEAAGVHTVQGTKRVNLPVLGQTLFSRYPYKVHRFARPALLRKAQQTAKHHPPDAIHCQNFYTALYAREIPALRKVLYQENFESLVLDRWAATVSNPLLKRLIQLERRRTLAFEMECPLWFDWLITISTPDEHHYREASKDFPETARHLRGRLRTVPPSIDLAQYEPGTAASLPSPFPLTGRTNLVFTGVFDYEANADGALWMASEVMPRLPKERFTLWLVGQNPSPAVQRLHQPPDVVVTGRVPDVRPYLYHAGLSVVPLRIGGGIRLKILEALALGCPVVSTSVGCEGLWNENDPPVWGVADAPEAFADAVERAVLERPDRSSLHAWVENRFSPERFVREMETCYQAP